MSYLTLHVLKRSFISQILNCLAIFFIVYSEYPIINMLQTWFVEKMQKRQFKIVWCAMLIIKTCASSLRRTDFPGPAYSGCDGIAEFTDTLGVDLIGSVTLIIDHTASCLQE